MLQVSLTAFLLLSPSLREQVRTPSIENVDGDLGTIMGFIEPPSETNGPNMPQALLLPQRWIDLWNSDLQKRLDSYFNRYRYVFARNPESFNKVSDMAHRDAIFSLIGRMEKELADQFTDLFKSVSSEGHFQFDKIPLGAYKIIIIANPKTRPLMWIEDIELNSSIPQFIRMQNRIQ